MEIVQGLQRPNLMNLKELAELPSTSSNTSLCDYSSQFPKPKIPIQNFNILINTAYKLNDADKIADNFVTKID